MLTLMETPRMAPMGTIAPAHLADLSLAILLLAKDPTGRADWVSMAHAAQPIPVIEEPTWEDAAWQ